MNFYIYDLETMFNCFLFAGKHLDSNEVQQFEISTRRNDINQLLSYLNYLQNARVHMVGFNSIGFDYEILHVLMNNPYTFNHVTAYTLAQQIISHQNSFGGRQLVRMQDRLIPQIDLLKINHFDNKAKYTSLKALQYAMRSESVEDLPFPMGVDLTHAQMDQLASYNVHDIMETEKFLRKNLHLIEERKELLAHGVLSGDVLNFSNVKIGTEYLIRKIGRQKCFISGSTPRQTIRQQINFNEIILPKIQYRTEPFNAVHNWFKSQSIYIKSDERPSLEVSLAGLPFHFGVGGVHASVDNKVFQTSETHIIKDIDVAGMYVAVAIANGFYPEHLGQDFVTAYRQLQADRAQHKKGTTMNGVLKLAGNGVYGNSNNPFSCFFDPKYTFTVTVNGQLQLIQLAELLHMIPGLEIIQANTDGITALVPRAVENLFSLWCNEWEALTGLKLEEVEYKSMFIRDVNNYIAVTKDGKVKRKGAYWYPTCDDDYEGVWNKDFSNMAAQKIVDRVMVQGHRAEDLVRLIADPFDFMLRYKTTAGATVYIGDKEMSKTVRYYVSKAGQPMKKIAKPKGIIGAWKRRNGLKDDEYWKIFKEIPVGAWDERIHTKNKSKYEMTETSIESGRLVKCCNRASDFNWGDVDFDYYTEEAKKLIVGI